MKALLSTGLLMLAVARVAIPAEPDLAALAKRLHTPEVLRGTFSQSKQIQGFKRPVVSSGAFAVVTGKGILWHTRSPFESMLSITRDRLRVTDGAGRPPMEIDARREPMLRTLNGLLQGVVVADLTTLTQQFDVTARLGAGDSWQMDLVPKDAAIASRFSSIALSGAAWVREVRLVEKAGDVTTVTLSAQQEDRQPTADEARALE